MTGLAVVLFLTWFQSLERAAPASPGAWWFLIRQNLRRARRYCVERRGFVREPAAAAGIERTACGALTDC